MPTPHKANKEKMRVVTWRLCVAIVVAQHKDSVVAIRALFSRKTGSSLLERYPVEREGSHYYSAIQQKDWIGANYTFQQKTGLPHC